MAKSKRQKKRDSVKKKTALTPVQLQDESDEKPFDFGGLPQRDLKKNLGCG